ncbi:MAG: hypothetical protein A2074_04100 [Candidatus Aquicultor primus]|uniref:Polysaccharide biosynthesis protein n=1 Tax=Candidatus Aquicultor primus TaxID=1797195 RepID=A0A1F2URP2_9ACTN|nr:MAG: hypothetical protein A2074_04100 [Candidatus Aquicultor primus]
MRRFAGVDRAVSYSIVARALSIASGLITIPLILTRLTPAEQGFYYTFGSILALQVFLEMGFGTVAIQMVAHDAAHLKIDLKSGVTGPAAHLEHFSATIRFVRNWYAVLFALVAVSLFPIGLWFFSTSGSAGAANWVWPWALMVLWTAGGVFVNCLVAIVEGMGFVAESVRLRLWGGVTQLSLSVLCLLAGFKLYALPAAGIAAISVNFVIAWLLLRNVVRVTAPLGKETRIDWVRDILPFQWRIALSWMSGWFIFNAMLPVVFRQLGPEEAGRFGLAMSILNFISSFAMNWTATKSAIWGQMVARKEWGGMDSLFWKVMPQAVGAALLGSLAAILAVPYLPEWSARFAGRVPGREILLLLCFVAVLNQVTYAEAFYLRAHKREPFLLNSVFTGLAMAVGLFGFSHSSSFSISLYYLMVSVFSFIWGTFIFVKCRASWHSPVPDVKEVLHGT